MTPILWPPFDPDQDDPNQAGPTQPTPGGDLFAWVLLVALATLILVGLFS